MKWLYRLTKAPDSKLNLPQKLKYFIDLLKVIKQYKSCKFHPSKSKLESLSLSSVYKYICGVLLHGSHNSLVDFQAQMEILTYYLFLIFIDRSRFIRGVEDIFSKKAKK